MAKLILKISGEALKDDKSSVSEEKLYKVLQIVNLLKEKHQIGIVVGGGNFFRGRDHTNMDKVTADTIGMLGTITNSLYLKDYFMRNNINACVSTPFDFNNLIKNYTNEELLTMSKENIIIFGGGVGKSGYSTDSGAYMAAEILESELIIKLTNVDGVYDSDPKINPDAIKYDKLTYDEVLENNLKVMDSYTIEKCKEKNIKILVLNFNDYKYLEDFFQGKEIGTLIGG